MQQLAACMGIFSVTNTFFEVHAVIIKLRCQPQVLERFHIGMSYLEAIRLESVAYKHLLLKAGYCYTCGNTKGNWQKRTKIWC